MNWEEKKKCHDYKGNIDELNSETFVPQKTIRQMKVQS